MIDIESVIREIKALREHATAEEKERLDWHEFHPSSDENCIYGLMTGHCDSIRAKELAEIAGNKKEIHPSGWVYKVSPLEVFIHDYDDFNFEILQYIKGEIDVLPDLSLALGFEDELTD
ncbi:hypothetical protein [Flavilitoribacter nigricans]|uniref:Uncharacterized protein n=1 Tax=Flavilitoribacter nigricans (strain ATCC 23147 / DSM 23189 / NBRC 102662 / NCIMB 1420 / SS-2) TaxID=1122177 RepID=A0A2D0NEM3_FLAN2|nr:hypothetical protein [Flavilitoribacter nigricans]PHN06964.1 hypothetical protein CRP01_09110 [Flavilitoribacter nigricans DSM 23189 = NBRC 102662]